MPDDSTAREGVEAVETPVEAPLAEIEEVEAVAENEAENQEGDGGEPGEQEEVVEEIEFDFGGNKMRVPKDAIPEEVAAELDKFTKGTWSDYTRKSQEVVETRKALEAREKAVEKIVSLNGDALNTYSRGLAVKAELEQLSNVDMNALWQSNPDQARQISDRISQKQAEFQSIVTQVSQKEQELTQTQQAELARRSEEGKQIIERRIKGFSEKAPEVVDYVVKNYGMTKEEAETWPLNPKTAEMAYKAMMFDRMQTKPKTPAPKQAAPVVPMKTRGSATAGKDVSKMSEREIAKYLGLPT